MALNFFTTALPDPSVRYDDFADVAYVTFSSTPASSSEEVVEGLVVRRDPAGEIVGLTLLDLRHFWAARPREMSDSLARVLPEEALGSVLTLVVETAGLST